MEKKTEVIVDQYGNALQGIPVLITTEAGATATLYADDGFTTIPNPVKSDGNGTISFKAANGTYIGETRSPKLQPPTKFGPFIMFDPADAGIGPGFNLGAANGSEQVNGTWFGGVVAKVSALATSIGASLIGFVQSGVGAVVRSIQDELRDRVSVKQFGATGDGVTDDTVAIQKALDAGHKCVTFPPGTYLCANLLMPATFGFILRGAGTASILKQAAGGASILRWDTSAINYTQGSIESLTFDGTNGANHCINTSGVGGLSMKDIYVSNVPTGFSGIYINGAAGTYVHDIRINGLQIYSSTAGHSGVRFGPLTSDTSVSDFIMNGNFTVQYCLYYDIGASTIRVTDAHPYNAAVNVAYLAGGNGNCAFDDAVMDNAMEDLVVINNTSYVAFTGCWLEAIKSGKAGLRLINADGVTMFNTRFDGAVGAAAAVSADSNSTDFVAYGGNLGQVGNYVAPFVLPGARCYAKGFAGYFAQGVSFGFSGATVAAQAQATTQYLGVNGAQASINSTFYLSPEDGVIENFHVEVGSTPAAGQTFTFNLQKNGVTIATITMANGTFGATQAVNVAVAQYDTIAIQSVFSATSGSATSRWVVRAKA